MSKCMLWSLILLSLISINGCESRKTDEERIREEVDAATVHLTIGLKLLTTNPENNPDIKKAQNTLRSIMDAVEAREKRTNASQNLTLAELGRLAKVAYGAKQLGEVEVARGRQSDFRFLAHIFADNKNTDDIKLTVEQDHALTLAGLYALKLHPSVPVPISQKALLYEAWMAGEAKTDNNYLNFFIRSLQASVFARNDYCDLALQKTDLLRSSEIGTVDMEALNRSMEMLFGFGRFLAHAPQAGAVIIPLAMLPAAIELFPGVVRIKAHIETAGCFQERGNEAEALKQQQYAIDAIEDMGVPESDISLLRAALAYKNDDLEGTASHLRKTQESKLIDDRSKKDLLLLADKIEDPDKTMVERYFSSTAMALTVGKIVNQRLKDEGFYEKLNEIESVRSAQKIYSGVMSADISGTAGDVMEDAKDTGKGLFEKLKQWLSKL